MKPTNHPIHRLTWTDGNGEKQTLDFRSRERAIYYLNILILDMGVPDAKRTVIR